MALVPSDDNLTSAVYAFRPGAVRFVVLLQVAALPLMVAEEDWISKLPPDKPFQTAVAFVPSLDNATRGFSDRDEYKVEGALQVLTFPLIVALAA